MKLFSRIIAVLLVPSVTLQTLGRPMSDTLRSGPPGSWRVSEFFSLRSESGEQAGVTGGATAQDRFEEEALAERALGALRSIFKGPTKPTFETQLTAISAVVPPAGHWTDWLPSPGQLAFLALTLAAHHFGHPGLSALSLAVMLSPGRYLAKRMQHMRLNPNKLARLTGVGRTCISNYLQDKNIATFNSVKRLVPKLNVSADHFWNRIVKPYAKRMGRLFTPKRVFGKRQVGPHSLPLNIVLPKTAPSFAPGALKADSLAFLQLIGARIRKRRIDQGLTQTQLGEASGLTQNQISSIELGKRDSGLSTYVALAKPLKASPESLLDPRPTLEMDTVDSPREITLPQIGSTLRQIVRHSDAKEWSRRTGLKKGQMPWIYQGLREGRNISLKTFYILVIRGLGADLRDVFKASPRSVEKVKIGIHYSEEEKKLYQALTGQDRTPEALRLKLAFDMLKKQHPRLAKVLRMYLLDDRSLEEVGRALDPKVPKGRERVRQLKEQAYAFLTLVRSRSLKPLAHRRLSDFAPFGLYRKLPRPGIGTLRNLLAAVRDGRLNQLYGPKLANRINVSLARIRIALNSAPDPAAEPGARGPGRLRSGA